jgi:hypothetical protein
MMPAGVLPKRVEGDDSHIERTETSEPVKTAGPAYIPQGANLKVLPDDFSLSSLKPAGRRP